jgi:hypothetical protein
MTSIVNVDTNIMDTNITNTNIMDTNITNTDVAAVRME